MPHYYFDLFIDEDQITDPEGTELPDETAIHKEVAASLYHLAKDKLPKAGRRVLAVSVRDQAGNIVLEETLLVTVERLSKPNI